MKGIFPCPSNLILPKVDIETINNEYIKNSNLNFKYFDENSNLILQNVNLLSVADFKKILGISSDNTLIAKKTISDNNTNNQTIDDDSILSNSFFTTLKYSDNEGETNG